MLNYQNFAISLARAVEVFRAGPHAVGEQKGALRALVALAKLGGAAIQLRDKSLSVESVAVPTTLPGIKSLIAQMKLHGVEEIRIAQNAAAADLLQLLRALSGGLSGYYDGGGLADRLQEAQVSSVRVLSARPEVVPPGGRPASVTDAFAAAGLVEKADRDEESAAIEAATRSARNVSPLEQAIEDLALNPSGPDVLERLTAFQELVTKEVGEGRMAGVVNAVSDVIRIEDGLPEGSARRSFAIVLQRIIHRRFLEDVVPFLTDPDRTDSASRVLQRAGTDGAELLLERLVTAESIAQRRAYFDTLRGIGQGTELAARLLDHDKWFVVRNIAELVGEMRLESAIPRLGHALQHPDPRVRRAAAVALARIGTAATVEHLRAALRKGDSEVRTLVAGAVGGRQSGALTMPLVFAAEEEPDAAVQQEFYLALARIGTPDAIQALIKAAQPGGRFFRRRRPEARLAAIHGLRAAGGPAAVGTLESLRDDPNRAVRQAAREALEDMGEA